MAKLGLLLATLALVLFLANASVYHTTITVDSEENPRGREESRCQQQIKKQNYLRHCQEYMEEQSRGSGRGREDYNRPGSKHLDSCCQQLEKLDATCRCPGLKRAVQQQTEEGEFGREELQELYRTVDKIMNKCDVEPRRCGFQPRNWF
ncbi:2S sulfur-rich seed storage protein 2-like [Herrania umbratica]|uniref:2S sulfur-rich seed storage protein 2-like n=1 Tax=Herrania umbratica TaxID=108875 RepID=A0A6J1ANF3_9ROSI|nr:2S sulfur-rich seed storage protein 2-like [Herrania umbratica]